MIIKQYLFAVSIGIASATVGSVRAQPADAPYDAPSATPTQGSDPPARVARMSYLSGSVSFTPAGENDWVQAQLNRPVVTGDKVWTDANARAELQIGNASVQLDQNSSFDFLTLNDQLAQIELTQGALDLDVRRVRGGENFEVDTPTIAFVASRAGEFRIDVNAQDGSTVVSARRGGGEAVGENGQRLTIEEGQSVRIGDAQLTDVQVNRIAEADDFQRYAQQRSERYARPARYVSEDMIGYEDLDDNGTWEDSSDYGHVWYPNSVAEDWAPYHDGHWAWVDPWGWTWVDDASWGFAPFHYGRWVYGGSRWGWVPGPANVAPVYAPALVAFVGGGGFGVSVGLDAPIGWFALGPRDVYFPGYRCGRDYFARVNFSNTRSFDRVQVNNYYGAWSRGSVDYSRMHFANRDAPRALAAVPARTFVSGARIAPSAAMANSAALAQARVLPRATLAPTRASLTAGRTRVSAPPNAALRRPVVAVHAPPPKAPSFAQRQALLQRNPGQPLSGTQLRGLRAPANRASTANAVRVVGNRGHAAVPASTFVQRNAGNPARNAVTAPANARAQRGSLPSARFAHPGATNAPSIAHGTPNARGPIQNGRAPQRPNAEFARRNGNPTATQAQHLRSSGFAHAPANNPVQRSTQNVARGMRNEVRTPRSIERTPPAVARHEVRPQPPLNENRTRSAQVHPAPVRDTAANFNRAPRANNVERTPAFNRNASASHISQVHTPHVEPCAPAPYRAPQNARPMVQHAPPPQAAPRPAPQQRAMARQQQEPRPAARAPQPQQRVMARQQAPRENGKDDRKHDGG